MDRNADRYTLVPPKALEEFITIFQEEFGKKLTDKEALPKALAVLELFKIFIGNENTKKLDLSEFKSNHK